MPEKVEMREAARLRMRYEKMRDEGNVVTGLHLKRGAGVDVSGLSDMELRVFISARGGEVEDAWGRDVLETRARAMGHLSDEIGTRMLTDRERAAIAKMKSVEKSETMVVFRRVGYTETDNPNHAVCVMNGAQACGMFMTTALVPSKMEVLEELEKFAATRNRLPAMIALDDERLALEVNVVSKQAGVQAGFYPVPSVEEQHLLASVPPKVLEDLKKVGSGGQGRAGVSA